MKIKDSKSINYEVDVRSLPTDGSSESSSTGSQEVDTSSQLQQDAKTFEDLLKICGEAGWWQFRIFLLASYCGFLTALQNLVYAFIGAVPSHWCALPEVEGLGVADLKNLTIPLNKVDQYEKCLRYKISTNSGEVYSKDTILDMLDRNTTEYCSDIDFDRSIFISTIPTEFHLVCGSTGWGSVIQAIFMIGILFGSPIFGSMSDKIGRKKTTCVASAIFIVAGPLVALAPNFETLMLARFILGASSPGIYATCFVLAVESVGADWRGLVGNLFCLPFALGYMALPAVAYFFRDWRSLQLVLCTPAIFQILVCWMIPESPRWLLRKGRDAEAEALLRALAKGNGRRKHLPAKFGELVQKVGRLEQEKAQCFSVEPTGPSWRSRLKANLIGHAKLFKTPKLRTRTLVIYACWTSISMVYYGVALNSPNLSADRYLYTFLSGVLEIPSYAMVPPLIKFFGRRIVFATFLFLCGLSLLGSLLFPDGSPLVIFLALVGKLLIGAAYALIYLYATEVMPTLLRTFGVGSASMVGRLGSASAPFIVDLMGREDKTNPTLVFGITSLFAGSLTFFLPETRNRPLPETVRDVEES